MKHYVRHATETDLEFVLTLNQASLEAVSHSNLKQLHYFLEAASYFKILCIKDKPAGFLIALMPGLDYKSENYRWISKNHDSFIYVDRIIIDGRYRNMGHGTDLYDDLARSFQGHVASILCEVNVKPYNGQSIQFHKKYGFMTVGEKDTENGTKRVSYMMYNISQRL